MYKKSYGDSIAPITWSAPKTIPDVNINNHLLLIASLNAFLNINSSAIGANIQIEKNDIKTKRNLSDSFF